MTTIKDTEKIILSYCVKNANSVTTNNVSIPSSITNELAVKKFETENHRLIYIAIKDLVEKQIAPTIPNILRVLGKNKDKVGGEAYLQSIVKFGNILGLDDFSIGYEPYVQLLDELGNLRELIEINQINNLQWSNGVESLYHELQSQDLDSYGLINNIIDDIQAIIKKSNNSGYVHISTVCDEIEEHLKLIESGSLTTSYVPTGFPSLKQFMFPKLGVLSVLQADTNAGKSTFAYLMALGAARMLYQNNIKGYVAINTLEDSKHEVGIRLACAMQNIVKNDYDAGTLDKWQLASIRKALAEIKRLPLVIDSNVITTKQLKMNAKIHTAKYGKRLLGVSDYGELFADTNRYSEERRLAQIANTLQGIAKDENSAELLISQITSYQDSEYLIPGHGSTRQSQSIAHAARQVATLYNIPELVENKRLKKTPPEYANNLVHIIMTKNKGVKGSCGFRWYPKRVRFEDALLPDGVLFEWDV